MSIWEDKLETVEAKPAIVRKWNNEEESDDSDLKDNWDDSGSESEEEVESVKPAPKTIPKPSEPEKKLVSNPPVISEKELQESLVVESDIQNAEDLFAGLTIKDVEFRNTILSSNPRSEEDFTNFGNIISNKIKSLKSSKHYTSFVPKFVSNVCDSLTDKEITQISRSLKSLAHEKQRLAKAAGKSAKKSTGKSKSAVVVDDAPKGKLGKTYFDDNVYEAFDDFM
ncbi:hypothetical protein BB560_005272 [Smittium megazygosporum]|uniref:Eukaryotic translation initiation factor 3 30 kDa subunit n=1 Tax=Smittium megazygosporum TaxID=133381 RepID=A0A2T9Z6X5_9FUNG|nr:hypothetical protein BB560_005272 [Smittium megazygosporum]